MGVDVATLLAQYEDAPANEPMHGQQGQIRRNPSTDQRKVRRQMTKKQAEVASVATIAELRQQAALAPTLEQKTALIAEAERLESERMLVTSAERALDFTVHEAVEIVPHGTHELHTEQTDWLTALASEQRGDETEATQALVAEASMWFERVPDFVKAEPTEFGIQATAKARREASQWGAHAQAAAQAFLAETARLHRLAVKGGLQVEAAMIHDLENGGMVPDPTRPTPQGRNALPEPKAEPPANDQPHEPATIAPNFKPSPLSSHIPHLHHEIDRVLRGDDAAGVREMAEGYAHHVTRAASLSKAAALRGESDETADLGTVLAGFELTAAGGELGVAEEALGMAGGGGGSSDPIGSGIDSMQHALDSSSNGVRDASNSEVDRELSTAAASTLPQVGNQGPGGSVGLPTDTFPTFGGSPGDPGTDSNRAPALQEIQNFTGWDGTSVVPTGDSGAAAANSDFEALQDASDTPLASAYAHLKTASKEHSMTEHAQCPTCGGHGKVAVRKQAYSGLPQIDQIVNADESPGTTPLPTDVAFPLTGWGQTPQQGQQNIQNAINETEGQVAERNAKSPLLKGSSVHQANGRDNSGWLGDNGAKGLDYPGYSAPTGYDGSNNLGEPDPVYGYGGDNGNQPLKPYGAEEANDVTNNPPQTPFDYSGPNDAGQGYRSVGPGMSTQGSADPFIAAAQEEILRQQSLIRERTAQLRD